ncbi:MAG: TonB-dependent receptor [Gammaproteobacteria bacterium]|nr:TonB-dependent receptor [Gammaproteobacteria bacterium]
MTLSAQGQLRLAAKLAFAAGAGSLLGVAHAADAAAAPAAGASAPDSELQVAQAGPAASANANAGKAPVELRGIEVTGSRIKQPSLTASAALQVVNSKELKFEGTVNVDSLLNNLPQVYATSTSAIDTQGSAATIDLRGLGTNRTLVLVDGKRLVPGDPTSFGGTAANVNFIPAALVDRVEVLTGGASAVYGSDAISGVVNFIMKKDFDGFEVDGQWSRTDSGDATNYTTTLLWGSNFSGGDGNVTLYAGYTRFDALTQDARDFSQFDLGTSSDGTRHVKIGSGTVPAGRIISYDQPYGAPYSDVIDNPNGSRTLVPFDGKRFNFNPFNFLQRPDKRYRLGGFAHRRFNEHADVYGSAMFMTDELNNQFAPSGTFFLPHTINCDNPLLSAQERGILCPNPGQTQATVASAKRTVEFGARQENLRNTEYRIVFGLRGAIVDDLSYDVSAQRSEATLTLAHLNDLSTARTQQALQVTTDSSGNPVCIDPSGGCVPFDLFQLGAITPAQKGFVGALGLQQGNTVEQVVTAAVNGDLTPYGIVSPLAHNGVGFAGGFEYRTETLDFRPDQEFASGDLSGESGPSPPVNGGFQVRDWFGELQLPIVENRPFVKELGFDTAYRLSNYSSAARYTHAYKFGLRYSPTEDVGLRASWNRAVRAPDVNELFFPASVTTFGGNDPCAGATPTATLAQCERSGVTPAQFGTILQCSAGQCNAQIGGNPNLQPEKSITRQAGIVLTPRFLKGFTGTIDYYNIVLSGAIGTIPPQTVLGECLQNGQFCDQIHRGIRGTLFGAPTSFISATNLNTGLLKERGVDFSFNYVRYLADLGLGDNGQVLFNFAGTYISAFDEKNTPTSPQFDCAGRFGQVCGRPKARWRHKARLTWENPMGAVPGFALSLQWRYIDSTALDANNTNNSQLNPAQNGFNRIDAVIPSKQYLDLAMTYQLPISTQDVTLRFGINNLGAEGPPVLSTDVLPALTDSSTANTFPSVYDTLGRVFFLGVTAHFR